MNTMFFSIAALFYFQGIYAQKSIEGSFLSDKKATEKIWKIEYKEISIYTPGFINEDKATLYISDDYSFCKTEFKESAYSAEDLMASDDSILVIDDDNFDESFNEIVVNRNEKTLTEYLFEDMVLKNKFAVEESLPEMKWELLEEKKRIGNYNCEKAKTVFRGRMYEVWYTPEIPLSSGPWKFNGLPGLVLSARDIQGIYSWEAISVTNHVEEGFDFLKNINNKSDFTKISYRDYDKKVVAAHKDRNRVFNTRAEGVMITTTVGTKREPINEWRTETEF